MRLNIQGVNCTIEGMEKGEQVIFDGTFPDSCDDLYTCLKEYTDIPFTLCRFELPDWERNCAPWDCECGGKRWEGGADKMLSWLQNAAIPKVREMTGRKQSCMIAGYSMAGLLALWTMYRTDVFRGAACCSGSLWYPEWDRFVAHNGICAGESLIYLSLGGKEASSGPEYMRCIGERMQGQLRCLKEDPNVRDCVLEMNAGGHFTKTTQRLAKGIAWLLNRNGRIEA